MAFLESESVRPLYDVIEGGSPKAFRCMLCFEVTKTVSGMTSHQFLSHGIKRQESLKFPELEKKTEIHSE